MYEQVDKPKENKSSAIANSVDQKQRGSNSTSQFVDNRPEAIVQRRLQEIVNNRSQRHGVGLLGGRETVATSQIPIQFVIPADNASALLLTLGTTRRGGVGKRQGKNHNGHALRAQLKLAGESDECVDAMVFREYDVNNETEHGRDDERVIHCSVTGRIWYTDDHYITHQEITDSEEVAEEKEAVGE